jgi:hypothetical protein
MEHASYPVDILDETGVVIDSKPRNEIHKPHDIYHTIHVILITPRGELVLSTIPVREDLPNLYARLIGTTMATIRRSGETAREAALRGMSRELFIDDMSLRMLGEDMYDLPDNRKNLITAYYGVSEPPESFSILDIESLVVMSSRQMRWLAEHQPEELAPTLLAIWHKYHTKLPI